MMSKSGVTLAVSNRMSEFLSLLATPGASIRLGPYGDFPISGLRIVGSRDEEGALVVGLRHPGLPSVGEAMAYPVVEDWGPAIPKAAPYESVVLTPMARDVLHLVWLSQVFGWAADDFGRYDARQPAALSGWELEVAMQNRLIAVEGKP